MDMVWHEHKGVELKAIFVAMLEESVDEEFAVGCVLEVAMLLEGRDCDGVCALLLADCGHVEESIPQGLKPVFGEA